MKQVPRGRYLSASTVCHPLAHAGSCTVRLSRALLILSFGCLIPLCAFAQSAQLSGTWQLDRSASSLLFQSVKNGANVETSRFANFDGSLEENGLATLLVELNSVDTEVDIRNVRMRFLFFETFKYPIAIITTKINSETLDELSSRRRMNLPVQFELDLHGVKKTLTADIVMKLVTSDQISITSASPVTIAAEDFNLMEGILKLQEAANVQILPSGSVSFDFTFKRIGSTSTADESTLRSQASLNSDSPATSNAASTPAPAALSSRENFSVDECATRFNTLSQSGAINFASGSSDIDPASYPVLDTLQNIIQRCPDLNIVVGGHTDSSGSDTTNLLVSTARAESVTRYLLQSGVDVDRVRSVGFGETQPLVPNDSIRNRARNRRIEFTIDARQ